MNCVQTPMQASTNLSALATPEPHYIPGYLGHVPQAKYRPGNTYGMTTHRILLDPCIHMSPRSMLSNMHPEYCTDDFGRPGIGADPLLNAQMALVKSRVNSFGRQQYLADMTPGYTGYIPRFQTILGHTYSPACNRALAAFETEQWRDRLFNKELEALDGWRFCYKTKPWESPEIQRTGGDLQEFARSPCCQQPKFLRNDVQCSTRAGTCGCGG